MNDKKKKNKKILIISAIVLIIIIALVLVYFFLVKKDKIYHNTNNNSNNNEVEDNTNEDDKTEVLFEGDIFKSNKVCDFNKEFVKFIIDTSEEGSYNYLTDDEEYYYSEIEGNIYSNISYEIVDKSNKRKKAACVIKDNETVLYEENNNNDCFLPKFSTLAGKYIVLENRCLGSGEDYDSKIYTNDLKLLSDDFDDYLLNSDDTITIEKGYKKTTYDTTGKKLNSTTINPTSISNSDTNIENYKKEVKKLDSDNPVLFYPANTSTEYLNAYNTLITNSYLYSLYFGKSTDLSKITDTEMLKYALSNYLLDNKLVDKNSSDVECFYNVDKDEVLSNVKTGDKCKGIAKSKIDEYIKDKFNTDRVFKMKNHEVVILPVSEEPFKFIYDEKTDSYYYATFPQSGGGEWLSRWLLKVEKQDDNILFYDKAIYCAGQGGWGSMYCYLPGGSVDLFNILEDDYSADKKELVAISDLDGETYDLNYAYIFQNYEIQSYKHTFKKVDNKYYWISSELVN